MKVVSFVNGKGGVGKTTLCANLAKGFLLEDDCPSITLVDADEQGSLRKWHNALPEGVEDDRINVIAADTRSSLLSATRAVSSSYMFIDTPGSVKDIHGIAIRLADLVVIPITPSYFDMTATIDHTVELVRTARDINPSLKVAMVLNLVDNRVKFYREIEEQLNELKDFYLLEPYVAFRQPFKAILKTGGTIFDTKDHLGKAEMRNVSKTLLDYLYQRP